MATPKPTTARQTVIEILHAIINGRAQAAGLSLDDYLDRRDDTRRRRGRLLNRRQILAMYDDYVDLCSERGGEPLSFEDFIDPYVE